MTTINAAKTVQQKWIPVYMFEITTQDAVAHYWATQVVTWDTHAYSALVLAHSAMRVAAGGMYGVEMIPVIDLEIANADAALNSMLVATNWQGATVVPRFVFMNPDDATVTSDCLVFGKFLADLPSEQWPVLKFMAHNVLNFARKQLPVSVITRKDRYPFPSTAAQRTAAGADPTSEYFPCGYDPDNAKGNYKTAGPPATYYTAADYNGTRDEDGATTVGLDTVGLSVRFGGFGRCPATISYTPKKGEHSEFKGSVNEAKYGQAVPLVFGTCRVQPPILDTGGPSAWNGARLSHLLLSDGVNYASNEVYYGIGVVAASPADDVQHVYIDRGGGKIEEIPQTSAAAAHTGSWSCYSGYLGNQVVPANKYRNIVLATDYETNDFPGRDLYSGLSFLVLGLPKAIANPEGEHPKVEVALKGLRVEKWTVGLVSSWDWSDNPVWIYIHLLKLLGMSTADVDKNVAYATAAYCDAALANSKKRFRCNLALMSQMRAADVLRGVRNCCRMYTTWSVAGKLQIKIKQNYAADGGAFALGTTNILRDADGRPAVKVSHKSAFELANVFTVNFQNEDNFYTADTLVKVDTINMEQIGEKIPADSITAVLGLPSYDQASRILNWLKAETVDMNEYYAVRTTAYMLEATPGMCGTLTEARHGLSAQQCRIVSMAPGPDGTVDLVLQKHLDAGYTDDETVNPLTLAATDCTPTPRSVGGVSGVTGVPTVTETFISDAGGGSARRRIGVAFSVPPVVYESKFTKATKLSTPAVATTGGTITGNQVLFAEVCSRIAGVDGLPSNYLLINVPAGTNTNKFTFTCELPVEATHYTIRVGTYPGRLFQHSVAASPGAAPFTVTVTDVSAIDSSLLSPDPSYACVYVYYYWNDRASELKFAGKTALPTQASFAFVPEVADLAEEEITVVLQSANTTETDFYPRGIAPSKTLALTKDSAVPTLPVAWGANLAASVNGLAVLAGIIATANIKSIVQAEFVFKFTTDLVTTMNMSTGTVKTFKVAANQYGAQAEYVCEQPGRVFIDVRMLNAVGWSLYLSGGAGLGTSSFYIDTKDTIDAGVPEGWTVNLQDHADDAIIPVGCVRAKLTLTATQRNLLWILFQVKDSSTGSWRALDANAGAAVTYYDGSAVAHNLIDSGTIIERAAGAGFGTASVGDLVLVDVRGALFGVGYTQWATVVDFLDASNVPALVGVAVRLLVKGRLRPQATSDLRVKIVKAPWTWATEGYLAEAGMPAEGQLFVAGSTPQKVYHSGNMYFGNVARASLDVRAWVETHYCRSDQSTAGGAITVSADAASVDVISAAIGVGEIDPEQLAATARAQQGIYDETFESGAASEAAYTFANKGTVTYPLSGVKGGKVQHHLGYANFIYNGYVPFDPALLYRVQCRVRRTVTTEATKQWSSVSVYTYTAAKAYIDTQELLTKDLSLGTIDVWYRYTAWFKGIGTGGTGTPTDPYQLTTGTTYFVPWVVVNYNAGATNESEIDEFTFDAFDEDGALRLYYALASNGEINTDKVIEGSVKALAITAGKISVASLSAINANIGTITAGTITGATVQTAASGARVVMDSTYGVRGIDSGGVTRSKMSVDGYLYGYSLTGPDGATPTTLIIGYVDGKAILQKTGSNIQGNWFCDVGNDLVLLQTAGSLNVGHLVVDAQTAAAEVKIRTATTDRVLISEGYLKLKTGYMEFNEMTEPAAPAEGYVRVYAVHGGAYTYLKAKFHQGAVQTIATEPLDP